MALPRGPNPRSPIRRTLAAAAALVGAAAAPAAGFTTLAFPAPVHIEMASVRSSLLLQLDVERYDIPYDVFAARTLDLSERAFRDFMAALRAGDAARLAAFRPGDTPDAVRRIVDDFRPGLSLPVMPRMIARVGVGDGQEFVWEWPRPGDPARLAFTVTAAEGGQPRVEVVTSARPLETLILDVFQEQARHPAAYGPVRPSGRYRYTFPLGAGGKPGAHPVALLFDGQAIDVELLGKQRARPAALAAEGAAKPALRVVESAYRALEERDLERYCGAYTDKSRDKLRAWIDGMPAAELDSFVTSAVRPRHVRFLLDADPVGIVFYTAEGAHALHYEYVLKTTSGTKLTNAYFEGFLDDVLRDGALFPTDLASFRKAVLIAPSPR